MAGGYIEIEGNFTACDSPYALVVSRDNSLITDNWLNGALDILKRYGVRDKNITIVKVPGVFEIPVAVQRLAKSGKYAAIIALGAVLIGAESPSPADSAAECCKGLAQIALEYDMPVACGILATTHLEQAPGLAGAALDNYGAKATLVALEMSSLFAQIH